MISFACQDIEFKDLLRCSFHMNKTEYNIMIHLLRTDEAYTTTQIGKAMNLDRTTVQKSINTSKLSRRDRLIWKNIYLCRLCALWCSYLVLLSCIPDGPGRPSARVKTLDLKARYKLHTNMWLYFIFMSLSQGASETADGWRMFSDEYANVAIRALY